MKINSGQKFKKKCHWRKSMNMNTLRTLRTFTMPKFKCFHLQNTNRVIIEHQQDEISYRPTLFCLHQSKISKRHQRDKYIVNALKNNPFVRFDHQNLPP